MKPFDVYSGRLLILAAYLDGLKPERFNFKSFVGRGWKGAQDLSCGCTACGMGHAVALFGEMCGVEFISYGPWEQVIPAPKNTARRDDPNLMMLEAATLMFDITVEKDFDYLFVPVDSDLDREEGDEATNEDGRLYGDASASDLAAHIRGFVKDRYEPAPGL